MIEDGIYVAFNDAGYSGEAVIVEGGWARAYRVSRFDDMDIYEYYRVDAHGFDALNYDDEVELCRDALNLQWDPEVRSYDWEYGFPADDRGSEPADIIDFFEEEIWS